METLGVLPDPRRRLRPDRGLPVHLRRDGGQLLLHPLAVAHPGGQLRGLPAAPQGEEQGGCRMEPRLELALETPGLWVHALRERQG